MVPLLPYEFCLLLLALNYFLTDFFLLLLMIFRLIVSYQYYPELQYFSDPWSLIIVTPEPMPRP